MGGTPTPVDFDGRASRFWHGAFFYGGDAEFVDGVGRFLQAGLDAGDPMLVVVAAEKIGWLRDHLGADAGAVQFADMAEVGRNPGRIIGYWYDFMNEHGAGHTPRGVGEPVFPSRSAAELAECNQHEALLNTAFDGGLPWWLLCPYDTTALAPEVLDDARRNHPELVQDGALLESPVYVEDRIHGMIDTPLPEPEATLLERDIKVEDLGSLRRAVRALAEGAGMDPRRAADLVIAVNELASNSLRHGGGGGWLRCWKDGTNIVCEVADRGRIADPLVGRSRPSAEQAGGRGVWMVHDLCDLVQLRTAESGTVVRVHSHLR